MVHRQHDELPKTYKVTPAASVTADLSKGGVLRFERKGGAMAGNPAMGFDEDGTLALYFADGASLYLDCA